MDPLLLCSLIIAGRIGIDVLSITAAKSQIKTWADTNGDKLTVCKPRSLQLFIMPFFLNFDVIIETSTDERKTATITFYRTLFLANMTVNWQPTTNVNFGRY